MLKLRKNKKGFTLVELIVVIAIMAVLAGTVAGVTVSQLNKQTNNTAKSEAQTLVSDFRNFMIDYTLPAPGTGNTNWKEGDKVKNVPGLTQAVKDFIKDNQQEDKLFLVEGDATEKDWKAGEHKFNVKVDSVEKEIEVDGKKTTTTEYTVTFYCKQKGNNASQKPTATYTYSDELAG